MIRIRGRNQKIRIRIHYPAANVYAIQLVRKTLPCVCVHKHKLYIERNETFRRTNDTGLVRTQRTREIKKKQKNSERIITRLAAMEFELILVLFECAWFQLKRKLAVTAFCFYRVLICSSRAG